LTISFTTIDVSIERVTIIRVSDSPSSQYRNRFTRNIVDRLLRQRNIIRWQWLYSEAGHGKGAADGVEAAIKRRCDYVVDHGLMQKVATAKHVLQAAETPNKLNISLFEVTSDNIAEFAQLLAAVNLSSMSGISMAHEVCRTASGILYRELTCLCEDAIGDCCECHNMRYWSVQAQRNSNPRDSDHPEPSLSRAGRSSDVDRRRAEVVAKVMTKTAG
jgi:hypothetical protein